MTFFIRFSVINAWCQFGISLADNLELLQLLYNHLLRVPPSEIDGDFTCELFNTLGHLIGQPVSAKCLNTFFQVLLPMTLNPQQPQGESGGTVLGEGGRTSLRQLIDEVLLIFSFLPPFRKFQSKSLERLMPV